jgi:hypothetical protein
MELFKFVSKSGKTCVVHTQGDEDKFNREWSLRVDGNPYEYYKREQDAKRAGTILKKYLIKNGCTIID